MVYTAGEEDINSTVTGDIFSARLDGSTPPVMLSAAGKFLVWVDVFGNKPNFRIAPDGQRVLYLERHDGFTDVALQSVRLDGTGLVDLVPAGESGPRNYFQISADSQYAFFPSSIGGATTLQRSRLDGSQTLTLGGPFSESVMGLELIPGGTGVVYATGISSSANTRLYSLLVPNPPLSLLGNPPASQGADLGSVGGFPPLAFTPEGKRVVFRGDLHTDEVKELYSALLDGSQPARRLNPPLSGNRDVMQFLLSPDGKRVIYVADQTVDNDFELFSVPVDGSGPSIRLNQTPVPGGDVSTFTRPEFSGRVRRAR